MVSSRRADWDFEAQEADGAQVGFRKIACPGRGMEYRPDAAGSLFMNRIRATWNGAVLAESNDTIVVEGNHYFPLDDIDRQYLRDSTKHTRCPWKGTASYYSVVVGDKENRDAAWYYPEPKPAAREISGRVAFWRGVKVESVASSDSGPAAGAKRPLLARLLRR